MLNYLIKNVNTLDPIVLGVLGLIFSIWVQGISIKIYYLRSVITKFYPDSYFLCTVITTHQIIFVCTFVAFILGIKTASKKHAVLWQYCKAFECGLLVANIIAIIATNNSLEVNLSVCILLLAVGIYLSLAFLKIYNNIPKSENQSPENNILGEQIREMMPTNDIQSVVPNYN